MISDQLATEELKETELPEGITPEMVELARKHLQEKEDRDAKDPMLSLSDEEIMKIVATGPEVIKKKHFEMIEQACKKEGVVSITSRNTGSVMPWRPKMTAYMVRVFDGERLRQSKWTRQPVVPGSTKMRRILTPRNNLQIERPGVERIKLFSVYPADPQASKEDQIQNMIVRFSAAKTILDQLTAGFQEHKKITEDEFDERIDPVSEEERDQETETTQDIPGGTNQTMEVREGTQDLIDAASEPGDGIE